MNDYISRDEVLEHSEYTENFNLVVPVRFIKAMKAADVQPFKWISCKDKMPEDGNLVLFCYVSENRVKSVHYGYHQTIKGIGSSWAKPSGGWQYADEDVTHWQPLPEPPKEDDT